MSKVVARMAWAHSATIKKVLELIKYEKMKIITDKFDIEKTYRRLYAIDNQRSRLYKNLKDKVKLLLLLSAS